MCACLFALQAWSKIQPVDDLIKFDSDGVEEDERALIVIDKVVGILGDTLYKVLPAGVIDFAHGIYDATLNQSGGHINFADFTSVNLRLEPVAQAFGNDIAILHGLMMARPRYMLSLLDEVQVAMTYSGVGEDSVCSWLACPPSAR